MSFNESLKSNSNYPLMSQSEWDNAPFNQSDTEEEDFNLVVSYTLSKEVPVISTEYSEDEHGTHILENPREDYENTQIKLQDIIDFAKSSAKYLLSFESGNLLSSKDKSSLKAIVKSCEGWVIDEYEVEQL